MQDDFLEVMLPVIGDSMRQVEQQGEGHADPAGGALDPSIAKALRRRQRGISSKKDLAEASTVFKVKATCILYFLACQGKQYLPYESCCCREISPGAVNFKVNLEYLKAPTLQQCHRT